MTFRSSALVPIFASVVVIALNVVLLIEGSSPSNAGDLFWLSIDTSKFGKNVVVFSPVPASRSSPPLSTSTIITSPSSSTSKLTSPPAATSSASTKSSPATTSPSVPNIFNPLNLPTPSVFLPPAPTISLPSLATGSFLPGLRGRAEDGLTAPIGLNLTDASVGGNVYHLYVTKMCQGNLTSDHDPNSPVILSRCDPYSDQNNGLSAVMGSLGRLPWSLVAGPANITFPPVPALRRALDGLAPFGRSLSRAMLAIVAARLAAAALALGGALAAAFDDNIRLHAVLGALAFAALANVSLLVGAAVVTAGVAGTSESAGGAGAALGLEVAVGAGFVAVEWAAAACSLAGTLYWLSVWFVEHRRTSFSRTTRRPEDVGNWLGIWSELKSDWRGTSAHEAAADKAVASDEEVLIGTASKKEWRRK